MTILKLYTGDRTKKDVEAIRDIRAYLNRKQWAILMEMVRHPDTTIMHINMGLDFAGVSGFPFHAFCRRYMLKKYRAWMAAGDNPVQTDVDGFRIEEEITS